MITDQQIKVAIIDDHTLFRKGLASLLKEFNDISIVFEAENGLQMQQLIRRTDLPDIILMDINMPETDGYTATAWLKTNYPKVKVLALSMFEDDNAVIRMIRAGACGYILKGTRPIELLEAIKTVFLKGVYINDLVSGKLMRSVTVQDVRQVLSKKELEFMTLCCSELTYKEIADEMCVSPRTVDNYREAVFEKLSLKSRSGIVLYAIKNGLFTF